MATTIFGHITEAPIDPILGTTQLFNADKDPRKINLGVGAYRSEEGKPVVLDVVRKAEEEMLKVLGTTINKEYSTIDGPAELKKMTQGILFGNDCPAIAEGRIASVQALSGTGALRVASEFVKRHMPQEMHEVYVSDPTWGNHNTIFARAGLRPHSEDLPLLQSGRVTVVGLRGYDRCTQGCPLRFDGFAP